MAGGDSLLVGSLAHAPKRLEEGRRVRVAHRQRGEDLPTATLAALDAGPRHPAGLGLGPLDLVVERIEYGGDVASAEGLVDPRTMLMLSLDIDSS